MTKATGASSSEASHSPPAKESLSPHFAASLSKSSATFRFADLRFGIIIQRSRTDLKAASPLTDGIHFLDARAPDGMRLYAIGDVHGRLDLLSGMHRQIAAEIERDRPAD